MTSSGIGWFLPLVTFLFHHPLRVNGQKTRHHPNNELLLRATQTLVWSNSVSTNKIGPSTFAKRSGTTSPSPRGGKSRSGVCVPFSGSHKIGYLNDYSFICVPVSTKSCTKHQRAAIAPLGEDRNCLFVFTKINYQICDPTIVTCSWLFTCPKEIQVRSRSRPRVELVITTSSHLLDDLKALLTKVCQNRGLNLDELMPRQTDGTPIDPSVLAEALVPTTKNNIITLFPKGKTLPPCI